jgi:hypothetical protein
VAAINASHLSPSVVQGGSLQVSAKAWVVLHQSLGGLSACCCLQVARAVLGWLAAFHAGCGRKKWQEVLGQ